MADGLRGLDLPVWGATAHRRGAIGRLEGERSELSPARADFLVFFDRGIRERAYGADQCRPAVTARDEHVVAGGAAVREQPAGSVALGDAPFADMFASIGGGVLVLGRGNLDEMIYFCFTNNLWEKTYGGRKFVEAAAGALRAGQLKSDGPDATTRHAAAVDIMLGGPLHEPASHLRDRAGDRRRPIDPALADVSG